MLRFGLPASNCGLISTAALPPLFSRRYMCGSISFSEINDTSVPIKSTCGRSAVRISVCSMETTRGSQRRLSSS